LIVTKSTGKVKRAFTVHTIESLMEKTIEEGDCRLWTGYIGNNTPQVSHEKKMVMVRRLILKLKGKRVARADHVGTTCGVCGCVEPSHIQQRTRREHSSLMGLSPNRNRLARAAKMAKHARENRAKLSIEIAREIRASDESGPVWAARLGITRGLVSRIRRGQAWREFGGNPFAGLGA